MLRFRNIAPLGICLCPVEELGVSTRTLEVPHILCISEITHFKLVLINSYSLQAAQILQQAKSTVLSAHMAQSSFTSPLK